MRVHNFLPVLCAFCSLAAAAPDPYPGARDVDIEFAAKTSFNFRMVLRGQVRIRVTDGIVTLSGRVEDQSTRSLATETVEHYPGVERVINNVAVRPMLHEFSDGWIAQHVQLRLLVKKGANPDAVSISVAQGQVTLRGTTESQQQKEDTATYAREVVGVNAIVNHLVVVDRPAERRRWDGPIDDASITSQLRHALRECPEIEHPDLAISTSDGRIQITGTVGHEFERSRITELALQVRGSVSVENLTAIAP